MPGLILPRRWTFQPPTGAQIDWSRSINKDLVRLYAFNEGGGIPRDHVRNIVPSVLNGPTWTSSRVGSGMSFASASSQAVEETSFSYSPSNGFSALTWTIAGSGTTMCPWGLASFGNGYEFLLRVDSPTWNFYMHASGGDHAVGWTSGVTVGALTQLVGVWDWQATTISIYGNGVLRNSAGVGSQDRTPDTLCIGSGVDVGAPVQYYNGSVFLTAFWSRALNAIEVEQLYSDPWCMFATPRYQRWLGYTPTAAVGGGGRNFAVIIG